MDALTASILQQEEKAKEVNKRGYPSVTYKCWECGKAWTEYSGIVTLTDWLKWEAEGKQPLSGECKECLAKCPEEEES